jgi:hypothetical protein
MPAYGRVLTGRGATTYQPLSIIRGPRPGHLVPPRDDDRLPQLLLKPLEKGGAAGRVPEMAALLQGAYAEFGWDPTTGYPKEGPMPAISRPSAAAASSEAAA